MMALNINRHHTTCFSFISPLRIKALVNGSLITLPNMVAATEVSSGRMGLVNGFLSRVLPIQYILILAGKWNGYKALTP
jgi:hypothetical protein